MLQPRQAPQAKKAILDTASDSLLMDSNSWELFGIASKWCSLLAMAGVIGGVFSLGLAQYVQLPRVPVLVKYVVASAVFGICMTLIFFVIQVGAINQTGITGMMDRQMGAILLQSSLGHALGLRVVAFLLVIINWLAFWQYARYANASHAYKKATYLVPVIAIVLLGISFALTGHTSALPLWARAAIVLHVLAAFLWVGSLFPLLRLSSTGESSAGELLAVKRLMQCFGTVALWIVGVLLLAGASLLTLLLESFNELITTNYGSTILLKLTGVALLLMLASVNKLFLVPRLTQRNSVLRLQASIRMEIAVAICVLAITAWLTTAVGPANL